MKCVTFLICALVFNVCYCQEQETPANNTVTTGDLESKKNETSSANENTTLTGYFPNNMGSIKRAMYVFLGVTVIVIVYFGIRTYRSRRKKVKSYGLLNSQENMELNPLNSDSEDDYTVFEAKPIY